MLLQYKYHSIHDKQILFWRGIFEEIFSLIEFCKNISDIFRNVRCYTNATAIKVEELLTFLVYVRGFTKYRLYQHLFPYFAVFITNRL